MKAYVYQFWFYKTFLQSYLKKEVKAQKSNKYIFFPFGKGFGFWKNCLENIEKLTAVAFDVDNWHRFSRYSPSMSWLWATTWMIRPPPPSHARHLCTAQSWLLTISCTCFDSLYKYCKIVSSNTSRLEAHVRVFRLLQKGFLVLMYCDIFDFVINNGY